MTKQQLDRIGTKKRFLEIYKTPEAGGNISTVCHTVGINRQTYYNWLEEDEQFRNLMYEAKMEKCDEMEQQLYQRGYEKDTTALIFWLKNNHPVYKEKQLNQFNQQVNYVFTYGEDQNSN